jgi:hypothetical protein
MHALYACMYLGVIVEEHKDNISMPVLACHQQARRAIVVVERIGLHTPCELSLSVNRRWIYRYVHTHIHMHITTQQVTSYEDIHVSWRVNHNRCVWRMYYQQFIEQFQEQIENNNSHKNTHVNKCILAFEQLHDCVGVAVN